MKKTNAFNGNTVKILIITDRLHEYAKALYAFFLDFQDIECNLIYSAEDFNNNKMDPPDFLLFAGFFAKKQNYNIIEKVCKKNKTTYCILLEMIDSCILSQEYTYNYHDCFERRLPNEDLLIHLQELQNKRLNGFQYDTFNQRCNIIYNHGLYDVTAYSDGEIIHPKNLGIYPAGPASILREPYIKYDDLYCIIDNTLTLSHLHIYEAQGMFPVINGVAPICSANSHIYKNPDIPIRYTGTLFLARNKKQICNAKDNSINTMFGYKELLKLTLNKGQVISCEDMKTAVKKVRSLYRCLPFLKYKKHLSLIQKYFLETYESIPMPYSKDLLFEEYKKFFSKI